MDYQVYQEIKERGDSLVTCIRAYENISEPDLV
jgi:hypothetical protein